jgi:hypothetical protein
VTSRKVPSSIYAICSNEEACASGSCYEFFKLIELLRESRFHALDSHPCGRPGPKDGRDDRYRGLAIFFRECDVGRLIEFP